MAAFKVLTYAKRCAALLLSALVGIQCAAPAPSEHLEVEACELHGAQLLPDRARRVRLEDLSSQVRGFLRGYGHRFPNAHELVVVTSDDSATGPELVEVAYCPVCREVRFQCLLEAFS